MTSLLNGNVFKLGIILFLVSSLLMILVSKVRKIFAKNKAQTIVYLIILLVLFAATGLLNYEKILNDSPLNSYVGTELIFFILGIVHIFVLRTYFKELSENKSDFFGEVVCTIIFVGIALLAFIYVVGRFREPFVFLYASAGLTFIIPLLILKMYEFAALIPVPIYKKWFYPVNKDIKEPKSNELNNPLVISFQFEKKYGDKEISRFKVKAPEEMEFGRLFYFFVDDYNELHPEDKIDVLENDGSITGWIFYFKPRWWNSIRHIDANKTVQWNKIREDNNIVVQRINS